MVEYWRNLRADMKYLLLAIVTTFAVLAGALADSVVYDGVTYTIRNVGTASIAVEVGTDSMAPAIAASVEEVTIPESFTLGGNTYTVFSVGGYAFYNCSRLKSVSLPESVTSIGKYAFYGSGLKEIEIPSGVTELPSRAFQLCSSLEKVTLPDSVVRLRDGVFRDCVALREITLGPGYYSSNNDYVQISRCTSLTNAVFRDGATSISKDMFAGDTKLVRVVIPASVTWIGENAFRDSPVRELTIPECVIAAGVTNVFPAAALSLESLKIVSGTTLSASALSGLVNLKTLVVADSVSVIEDGAFEDCSRLTDITLPSGVDGITSETFNHCSGLWAKLFSVKADTSYDLAADVADGAVASITVYGDTALDDFVLKDGKVYDAVVRVENASACAVTLSLPAGYAYETFYGSKPLSIPANSINLITLTRTGENRFLVSRRKLQEL